MTTTQKPIRLALGIGLALAAASVVSGVAEPPSESRPGSTDAQPAKPAAKDPAYVLDHEMKLIDGTPQRLDGFKGKVILIVNTASKCGYTPQYAGLEKLYADHKDKGLVVLGFPANNFGSQEPGSNKEIAEFCSKSYGVSFPMFEKISVAGKDKHPLYEQLASQAAPIGGDPKWNFTKFLVDRSGHVVARYDSRVRPDDKQMVAKIEELLKAEAPASKPAG
ncbi:MAG: glutathione peroxidase [Phycisphaerales bacterium]|nr:glutathione peroxidase [Phycisphaerales bacterium]